MVNKLVLIQQISQFFSNLIQKNGHKQIRISCIGNTAVDHKCANAMAAGNLQKTRNLNLNGIECLTGNNQEEESFKNIVLLQILS